MKLRVVKISQKFEKVLMSVYNFTSQQYMYLHQQLQQQQHNLGHSGFHIARRNYDYWRSPCMGYYCRSPPPHCFPYSLLTTNFSPGQRNTLAQEHPKTPARTSPQVDFCTSVKISQLETKATHPQTPPREIISGDEYITCPCT